MMADKAPKVSMRGITKTFPGVVANSGIDIDFYPGEVHALLGENGAGKTTLMNILYGLHKPDEGTIAIDGRVHVIDGPNTAISLGIGMVHQHFMLVQPFTVAENIVLGSEPKGKMGYIDMATAIKRVRDLSETYGLRVDPNARVDSISVGMQQRVEILKALYRGADILILDEPTAVLTPQEVIELKNITDGLAAQGKTIIIITHKLKEVLSMARIVTVIRRGKKVASFPTANCTMQECAVAMVGRDVELEVKKAECNPGEPILEAQGVACNNNRGMQALKDINLTVRQGEILGIAGVEGNGQSELVEVLTGLRKTTSGSIRLNGVDMTGRKARGFGEAGVAHIPEDRQKRGLVLEFSIAENCILDTYHRKPYSKGISLNGGAITETGKTIIRDFDVRTPSEQVNAKTLSGGNQQKVIIGRELSKSPECIIAAQPTRGLDVGAIEFVHGRLLEARDNRKAVLLVSLELDEILALSDRIAVMYEGRIVAMLDAKDATEEELGLYMAGMNPGQSKGVGA